MIDIDPTAVKVGDTVTLERVNGGLRLQAEVNSQFDITIAGKRMFLNDFYRDGWTLTDHQPAPKPEWREGIAGTAVVGPNRREVRAYAVGKGAVVEAVGGGYAVWNADDVHTFVPDEARPLPTRDEVADAMHDDHLPGLRLGRKSREMLADAVLAFLRGES